MISTRKLRIVSVFLVFFLVLALPGPGFAILFNAVESNSSVEAALLTNYNEQNSPRIPDSTNSEDYVDQEKLELFTQALSAFGVGLYSRSSATAYIKYSATHGPADVSFPYGPPINNWLPIAGDWNGNGVFGIALYDQLTGIFHIKDTADAGVADRAFQYGPPGNNWLPVAGDWNGNGSYGIGLYDQSTGLLHVKDTADAGVADRAFQYGPPNNNWLPIAGDWDGNGNFGLALYEPASGLFYVKDTADAGVADRVFAYGPPGNNWLPVAGDWNGNSVYGVALYNQGEGLFFMKAQPTDGPADSVFPYGPPDNNWLPIAGNWRTSPTIDQPEAYQDMRTLMDYIYMIQMLKLGFVETISNGFTSDFVSLNMVEDQYVTNFFDDLTELYEAQDTIDELIEKHTAINMGALVAATDPDVVMKASDFDARVSIQEDIETQAILSLGILTAVAAFGYYCHRSRVRSREAVLTVVSNMTEGEREAAYNDAKASRVGGSITHDNSDDFWLAVQNKEYDNQMAVLHNDLSHPLIGNERYSAITQDPEKKLRPIDRAFKEGAEGCEKGAKLVVASIKAVAPPGIGQGMDYAEKADKYLNYANDTLNGEPGKALQDYVTDQVKDYVDDATVSGASDALELFTEVVLSEDPTLAPPPSDSKTGVVLIVDSDEEGEKASIASAIKKPDPEDPEQEEIVVVSETVKTDSEDPEETVLIIPLPEGSYQIDVLDKEGVEDSVDVEVTGGTDTVVHVDTTNLGDFYLTRSILSEEEGSIDYLVTAHVLNVTSQVDLTLSLQNAMVVGDTTKTLTSPGTVSWTVTILQQTGYATIRRSDTGEGRTISLPSTAEEYTLSLWVSPASPAASQGVTVYARVTPAVAGVDLRMHIIGTDNYSKTETNKTNQEGIASMYVPGGAAGVRDTITVTVVSTGYARSFSYTFN